MGSSNLLVGRWIEMEYEFRQERNNLAMQRASQARSLSLTWINSRKGMDDACFAFDRKADKISIPDPLHFASDQIQSTLSTP